MLNVNVECQMSACLVKMIWVKDQHAQAQQWFMHAQAWAQAQHRIMHAQAWAQAQAQAHLQRKRLAAASSEAEPVVQDRGVSTCPCPVGATLMAQSW